MWLQKTTMLAASIVTTMVLGVRHADALQVVSRPNLAAAQNDTNRPAGGSVYRHVSADITSGHTNSLLAIEFTIHSLPGSLPPASNDFYCQLAVSGVTNSSTESFQFSTARQYSVTKSTWYDLDVSGLGSQPLDIDASCSAVQNTSIVRLSFVARIVPK